MALWDNLTNYFSDFSFGKVADDFEGFLGNVFEPEMKPEFTPYKSSQSFVGGSTKFPPRNRVYMGADKGYKYFDQKDITLRRPYAGRDILKQANAYTRGTGFRGTLFEYPAAIVGGTFSTLRDVVNDYIVEPVANFRQTMLGKRLEEAGTDAVGAAAQGYMQGRMQQPYSPLDKYKLQGGNMGKRVGRFTQHGPEGTAAQFVSGKTGISKTLMNVLGSTIQDADVLPNSDMAYLKYFVDKQQSQGVFTGIRDVPGIKTTLSKPPVQSV